METTLDELLVTNYPDFRQRVNAAVHKFYTGVPSIPRAKAATEELLLTAGLPQEHTAVAYELLTRMRDQKPRKTLIEAGVPHYAATHSITAAKATQILSYIARLNTQATSDAIDAGLLHDGVLEDGHFHDAHKREYDVEEFKEEKQFLEHLTRLGYIGPIVLTAPLSLNGKQRKVATTVQTVRSREIGLYLPHIGERLANAADCDFGADEEDHFERVRKHKNQKWVPQRFTSSAEFAIKYMAQSAREPQREYVQRIKTPVLDIIDKIRDRLGVSREIQQACVNEYFATLEQDGDIIYDAISKNYEAFGITPPRSVKVPFSPSAMTELRPA